MVRIAARQLPRFVVIEQLLPLGVACAESTADGLDDLFPEERRYIAGAVAGRRAEFATTRACARRALHEVGIEPTPLLPGPGRAPQWPEGVIGSLTHCTGYRGAAVARRSLVAAIGIDAEPAQPLPSSVHDFVLTGTESVHVKELDRLLPYPWDRMIFSAKESIFKAWYPLTAQYLDFLDVDILLDIGGCFTAEAVHLPHANSVIARMHGRWSVQSELILTAATLDV